MARLTGIMLGDSSLQIQAVIAPITKQIMKKLLCCRHLFSTPNLLPPFCYPVWTRQLSVYWSSELHTAIGSPRFMDKFRSTRSTGILAN